MQILGIKQVVRLSDKIYSPRQFIGSCLLSVFEAESLIGLGSLICLEQLVSESQGSICLYLPRSQTKIVWHHTQLSLSFVRQVVCSPRSLD